VLSFQAFGWLLFCFSVEMFGSANGFVVTIFMQIR